MGCEIEIPHRETMDGRIPRPEQSAGETLMSILRTEA